MVLPSSPSLEGVPAAKSTPCFSFHLAPLMTKCATIPVDNNLSTNIPLPLFLLTSTPVYCASTPRGLHQPCDTTLPSSYQTPFTNLSTLSTTNTLQVTYNHFTSFTNFPLTFTTHLDTLNTMAPRKNTKSTSTPAPVADSKIAKAYTGRKTRAMKAAEEKAAAEPGNTAAHADVEPVETADMPKPPKPNTLKSASNALKALKGAAKTNQNNDSTTMQASSSAAKPTTSTPAVSNAATTTPVVTAAAVSNTVITAPVATAAPPPSPEFHGVPPAGFDSGRSQREIDAGLTKFQAQQAKKAHLWGTQVKPVRPEDMASDFEAMGFGPEKVKELVAMKEPVQVDGLTQRCTKDGLCVPGTGPELPKRVRKPRGQGKYQNLVVFEDKGMTSSLPPHSFNCLHMLIYINRLGSVRPPQAIPNQARRPAPFHHQMGQIRAWQRPNHRHEHEIPVSQVPGHTKEPQQQESQLHRHRPKDRGLGAHPKPQQEGGRARHRTCRCSSPRPWRQA